MTTPDEKRSAEGVLDSLLELLAESEHDRWSRWHRYASKNWMPDQIVRWNKLAETDYKDLPEPLKESDRKEVRLYMHLIAEALTQYAEEKVYEAMCNEDPIYEAEYGQEKVEEARAEALEEAAKVAETIYGTQFHGKAEVRTGRKIALNIRALKGAPKA